MALLSTIYPPGQFRTGLFQGGTTPKEIKFPGFLTDPLSYFTIIAFPTAFILKSQLEKKWKSLIEPEAPRVLVEAKLQDLDEEWRTLFDPWTTTIVTILSYVFMETLLRTFGKFPEPWPISLAWELDEFLGIWATIWVVLSGFAVANFIVRKLVVRPKTLDACEKMGGWRDIATLGAVDSLMIGLTNGIWLLPWMLFALRAPNLNFGPSAIMLLNLVAIVASIGTIALPTILFGYVAVSLAGRIRILKRKTVIGLQVILSQVDENVMNSVKSGRYDIGRSKDTACYLSSQIDKAKRIDEWPLDSVNVSLVTSSIILQVIQIIWYISQMK